MQVMSLAQLLLPQVLSKPDILHASRLPRLTEAGAARASECTDSSGEKACKEEALAARETAALGDGW